PADTDPRSGQLLSVLKYPLDRLAQRLVDARWRSPHIAWQQNSFAAAVGGPHRVPAAPRAPACGHMYRRERPPAAPAAAGTAANTVMVVVDPRRPRVGMVGSRNRCWAALRSHWRPDIVVGMAPPAAHHRSALSARLPISLVIRVVVVITGGGGGGARSTRSSSFHYSPNLLRHRGCGRGGTGPGHWWPRRCRDLAVGGRPGPAAGGVQLLLVRVPLLPGPLLRATSAPLPHAAAAASVAPTSARTRRIMREDAAVVGNILVGGVWREATAVAAGGADPAIGGGGRGIGDRGTATPLHHFPGMIRPGVAEGIRVGGLVMSSTRGLV
ncbi:unnamed protein product, partial [Ectocarpus sp. 4 AP-2014]